MLRHHVAFYLPQTPGEMVVAEALDFPGAVTQGFDLQDARLMTGSALEDLAQALLEEDKPLPVPPESMQIRAPTLSNSYRCLFIRERLQGEAARVAGSLATAWMYPGQRGRPPYVFLNLANGAKAPVPRHGEIDNRLHRKIWEQSGIPPIG